MSGWTETDRCQSFCQFLFAWFGVNGHKVFVYGYIFEEPVFLKDGGEGLVVHAGNGACVRFLEAHEHVDECGFPGAGGSHENVDFVCFKGLAVICEYDVFSVCFANMRQFNVHVSILQDEKFFWMSKCEKDFVQHEK